MKTRLPDKEKSREKLEQLFKQDGFLDFKWIDPKKIIVAQWVRMKCMFGCGDYGKNSCCPPNVPSVSECERFFHEYGSAVIFHFKNAVEKPEDRFKWTRKINMKLSKLEREVFISGYERAFLLVMDTCNFCEECGGKRENCKQPRISRPTSEAMGMDVYSTVRQFGYHIELRSDYSQEMDRYAFLMIE